MNAKILLFATALLCLSVMLMGCEEDCVTCLSCEQGGEEDNWRIVSRPSWQYLNHRFFFLDLPMDLPGRDQQTEFIDPNSVMIFRQVSGVPQASDIGHAALWVDETGRWSEPDPEQYQYSGSLWRPVPFDLVQNIDGQVVAFDLRESMSAETILGVVYEVVTSSSGPAYHVGDRLGVDDPVYLPGLEDPHHRMKLLKGRASDQLAYPHHFVLRNIYDMGAREINPDGVEMTIEWNQSGEGLNVDETGLPNIRLFGLDQMGSEGSDGPDGLPDFQNLLVFNLQKGLLYFPLDFPHPFAASEEVYELNADSDLFQWEGSFLQSHQTPEIYDRTVMPQDFPQYAPYNLVFKFKEEL